MAIIEETDFLDRYQRQLSLSEVGLDGQRALRAAHLLIVGLGGLGCPALQYLAAAGVGRLTLVDADRVSLSNLHRQTLYQRSDVGEFKVHKAAAWVKAQNPNTNVQAITEMFTMDNGVDLLGDVDLVLDCTDNFTARYHINDACKLTKKPWVYGSIAKFEGQMAMFNVLLNQTETASEMRSLNYRDVFPTPPADGEIQNCAEAGVLGALAGIIGSLQALEALKWILKTPGQMRDQLLTYNGLTHQLLKFQLQGITGPK